LITLINLGNSNLQSVINSLDYLNIEYLVSEDYKDIVKSDGIILPGVGTFESGILRLRELKMYDILRNEVLVKNKPILGICLGMQLLFESSEESPGFEGLGLIGGNVISIPNSKKYKIPRIGWAESILNFDFLGLKKNQVVSFYYIHSFYVNPLDKKIITIITDENLTAAINQNNIYGCQFHPEKSHTNGLTILSRFAKTVKDS
jgi:glutamine amidotransferase